MVNGQSGVHLVIVVLLVERAHTQERESVTIRPHLVEARHVLETPQKPKIVKKPNGVLVRF